MKVKASRFVFVVKENCNRQTRKQDVYFDFITKSSSDCCCHLINLLRNVYMFDFVNPELTKRYYSDDEFVIKSK